jgi:hypothetical protein
MTNNKATSFNNNHFIVTGDASVVYTSYCGSYDAGCSTGTYCFVGYTYYSPPGGTPTSGYYSPPTSGYYSPPTSGYYSPPSGRRMDAASENTHTLINNYIENNHNKNDHNNNNIKNSINNNNNNKIDKINNNNNINSNQNINSNNNNNNINNNINPDDINTITRQARRERYLRNKKDLKTQVQTTPHITTTSVKVKTMIPFYSCYMCTSGNSCPDGSHVGPCNPGYFTTDSITCNACGFGKFASGYASTGCDDVDPGNI